MLWFRRLVWRLKLLVGKEEVERELDQELRTHLEEEVRDARGGRPLDDLFQDMRYALRGLRRRPLFAGAAILTLTLGIGAATAMFSVVRNVLLKPLPYEDPEELVMIWGELRARDVINWPASGPEFAEFQTLDSYEAVSGLRGGSLTLTGGNQPEEVRVAFVTEGFFSVFPTNFRMGRGLTKDDFDLLFGSRDPDGERPSTPVVLSHGLWQRRWGGDPGVIGRSMDVSGIPMTVVGILPQGFSLLLPAATGISTDVEMIFPTFVPPTASRRNVSLRVVARLKDGISPSQAQAELDAHWNRMRGEYQLYVDTDYHGRVAPLMDDLVKDVRPMILILFGAVVLVLFIACANVAGLLLVRAHARAGEMAVRAALGGSRWRLARQMLGEGMVLGGIALIAGLILAQGSISLLAATRPVELPRMASINLDTTALGFSFLVSAGAVFLFGLIPALQGSRTKLARMLQGRGTGSSGRAGSRLRSSMVVTEVALSLVLLVGAGLMVRSTITLSRVNPGFNPENVMTFRAAPAPGVLRSPEEGMAFLAQLQERFSALPGVLSVSGAGAVPFAGGFNMGRAGPEEAMVDESLNQQSAYTHVLPGYFETLETVLLEGRLFSPEEYSDSLPVVIVDDLLAAALWPGESAVGKTLVARPGGGDPTGLEVVGVVGHQRFQSLRSPGEDMFYLSAGYNQRRVSPYSLTWIVRTAVPPGSLMPQIRREVAALGPDIPITRIQTLEGYLSRAQAPTRFALSLIAFFAVSALVLAVVGLYGVLAYTVQQQTPEIGVRMALGANRGGILAMVLGKGMRLSLTGILIGMGVSLWATRFMGSILVETPSTDMPTFAGVGLLFGGVATLACYLPAWKATRVDPVRAIQAE